MIKSIVLVFLFFSCSLCIQGIDVNELLSTSTFQCFKNNGFPYTIIRATNFNATLDNNVINNLNNARAAGLSTQIYVIPCRGTSPASQVNQIFENIPTNMYTNLWISIQTNPSQNCKWSTDQISNCNFLDQFANRIKSSGKNPGIYTSATDWKTIMGTAKECNVFSTQSLWYIQPDSKPNFNNFTSFGVWKVPNMKQYRTNVSLCGTKVNQNFYHFY